MHCSELPCLQVDPVSEYDSLSYKLFHEFVNYFTIGDVVFVYKLVHLTTRINSSNFTPSRSCIYVKWKCPIIFFIGDGKINRLYKIRKICFRNNLTKNSLKM